MKPEGVHPLEKLLSEIDNVYKQLRGYFMCMRIFRIVTLYQALIGVKLKLRKKNRSLMSMQSLGYHIMNTK